MNNNTDGKTCRKNGIQRITVFQQNGSGESKIRGIREFGQGRFRVNTLSLDRELPAMIDDSRPYLPKEIQADLVLDFLRHPDLSEDLADLCREQGIPLVASGKKTQGKEVITPPT